MVKGSLISNLMLSASSVVMTLLLAELVLRFVHPVAYRMPPERLPDDAWRALLHRPSSIPGLAYELAPNRRKDSAGGTIRTNSFGMRDDEPRSEVDHSLHRVVVLGDSYTFGFGVSGEDTYPNVLERLLNEKAKGERFEVLNLGVGGYSTRDEALVLEYKGMRWDPELVVIGYVLNDPEIDPVQPLQSYYQKTRWWQYSNVLRLVVKARTSWDIMVLGEGDYIKYLHADRRHWQSVVDGLGKIADMTRNRNIPVVLLLFPKTPKAWVDYRYRKVHQQVASLAEERGLNVIDLYDLFSQYTPKDLIVAPGDEHPSTFAHALTAEAIYRWIVANHRLSWDRR